MSEWRTAPLGSFVEFQRGIDITRATQSAGDVPVISSGGISSYHNVAHASGPGVVIGRKGTIGNAFYIAGPYWPHDTTLWVREFNGNDPKFVYYFMSKFDVSWLEAGSANPTLNRNHLHPVVVTWPDVLEQRAIAEVLSALDDKIAANVALAETQVNVVDHLFPRTQNAELARLGDYVLVTKGNSYRSVDLGPSSTALVTLKSITRDGSYAYTGLKEFTGPYKPQQVVTDGDIVVAQTDLTQAAEVVGRAVRVPSNREYKLVASLDLAIVRPREGMEALYLLGLLRQERFRTHARAHTTGTTVLHLASGAIEEYVFSLASSADQREYAVMAAPLLVHAEALAAQNRTLATTRDALLPQLMSGKLRVRDAEAIAADAGA